MNVALDSNWQMFPIAESDTGQAFKGISKQNQVLFIKTNTSPLVVALSQEGLAPRMVWSRRVQNGDVLTAQEWLNGRSLQAVEIKNHRQVARILSRLHHCEVLCVMLKRLGGRVIMPKDLLGGLKERLSYNLTQNTYLMSVMRELELKIPQYDYSQYVVVHGDVHHSNWMHGENQELYLVDWENVCFGDPARDLGYILGHYVATEEWNHWLIHYGLRPTGDLLRRIRWYAAMNILLEIERYTELKDFVRVNQEVDLLKEIFHKV